MVNSFIFLIVSLASSYSFATSLFGTSNVFTDRRESHVIQNYSCINLDQKESFLTFVPRKIGRDPSINDVLYFSGIELSYENGDKEFFDLRGPLNNLRAINGYHQYIFKFSNQSCLVSVNAIGRTKIQSPSSPINRLILDILIN